MCLFSLSHNRILKLKREKVEVLKAVLSSHKSIKLGKKLKKEGHKNFIIKLRAHLWIKEEIKSKIISDQSIKQCKKSILLSKSMCIAKVIYDFKCLFFLRKNLKMNVVFFYRKEGEIQQNNLKQ